MRNGGLPTHWQFRPMDMPCCDAQTHETDSPKPTRLTLRIPRLLDAVAEGPLAVTFLFVIALALIGAATWIRTGH